MQLDTAPVTDSSLAGAGTGAGAPVRAAWLVAVAATLGMSVSYIDRQTLAAIAPAVRAELAIDHAQFGWLVSAFAMAYLVATPLAGVALDRLGARRGFAMAMVVWSAVAGAHAFAVSFAMLFALRMLLGIAEAPSFPAAAQAVRRALPATRRPAAVGLLFTGSSLGAMIAAPLAIALETHFGFRFAFAGTALVGLLWLPLWLRVTRGTSLASPGSDDEGIPRSAATLGQTRWIDAVRSAPVLRSVVAIFGAAPSLMFAFNFTSQYLVEAWHLPKGGVGGLLVLPPLLFDIGAVAFGWRASRRGLRTHIDLLAMAAIMAALLALVPLAPSAVVAVGLIAASACGGGGLYVLVTADMLGRVPLDRASSAGGLTAASQSLAQVIAGPLVGHLIDRTGRYDVGMVALGLVALPAALVFALWPVPRKADPLVHAGARELESR